MGDGRAWRPGSLVLLAGEAGVGKTTLARRVLAGSGLQVLEGFGAQGGAAAFVRSWPCCGRPCARPGVAGCSRGRWPPTWPCCSPSSALPPPRATARPSLRRAVFDRTDGVPFFVNELASALASSGRLRAGPSGMELLEGADVPLPDSVRDAVLLRAAGLADEARAAVLAAAVAGLSFDPELVCAVAELDEWPDELLRLGIVAEAGAGRMAFRHALVRDAFYGEVPWTRRGALHRAVAERLQADHAAPVVVAEHWALGRRPGQARRRCWRRRRRSPPCTPPRRGPGHPPGADAVAGRGRRACPLDVLERLAGLDELPGDLGEAITSWREVVDGRRHADDLPRLAGAHRRLAAALELQGRWQEALASRELGAAAFTAAGLVADAAAERLTSARSRLSAWSPWATPTGRSPASCSSARARWRCTSAASW